MYIYIYIYAGHAGHPPNGDGPPSPPVGPCVDLGGLQVDS